MQPPVRPSPCGFTVVEVLVATAVLALVLVLFTQIVSNVVSVTSAGRARLDADGAARTTLDRLAADLQTRVNREDAEMLVVKSAGNDQLFFLGEGPAVSSANATDSLALIGYGISLTGGSTSLQRFARKIAPNDPVPFLPQRLVPPTISPDDVVDVADNVLRFELEFLLPDGSLTNSLPTRATTGRGDYVTTGSNGAPLRVDAATVASLRDVTAIVATVATIDPEARERVSPEEWTRFLASLESTLPDAASSTTPGQRDTSGTGTWSDLAMRGIPGAPGGIGNRLRVSTRIIPLHE